MPRPRVNPFVSSGALKGTEKVYVVRDADDEVLRLLRAGRFVQLAEPRQQGKSSLLNRLSAELRHTCVIVIKATNYSPAAPTEWYSLIGSAIYRKARACRGLLPRGARVRPPENPNQWAEFLTQFATAAAFPVVVAIDEVDLIKFPGSDHFYSVIKNVRDLPRSNLSFVLSGCFHPLHLVENRSVSPFNAANRVRLPDFKYDQVLALADEGPWRKPSATAIAQQVFDWTDGHPYLTQLLFSKVAAQRGPHDVEAAVKEFLLEDAEHLSAILRRLGDADAGDLRDKLNQILAGERVGITETLPDAAAARLRLLGVIKPDQKQFCRIRNRIYDRVLRSSQHPHDVFISYRREDDMIVDRLRDELVNCGLRCFVDQDDIPTGAPFPAVLRGAIESSAAVVLVLGPNSLKECDDPRDWLRQEVEHAYSMQLPVIPVLIQDCPRPDVATLPSLMKPIAEAQALQLTRSRFPQVAVQIKKAIAGHGREEFVMQPR